MRGAVSLHDDPKDPRPDFLPRNVGEDPAKIAKSRIQVVGGDMTIAFGAIKIPLGRDAEDGVRFVQLFLAFGVADTLGVLLTLVWTAGFLPTFLDPSAVSVLLAKPVPRWSLLVGKCLGVITFVAAQAVLFIVGTWFSLGLTTGIWDQRYLLAIPVLVLHFGIFYSFSTLLAVLTRSTVACVFGSLLFWFGCWAMNLGHHAILATPDLSEAAGGLHWAAEFGYWILPKPGDLGLLLYEGLQADRFFGKSQILESLQQQGLFYPGLSVLSSALAALALVVMAAYEFTKTDY
jgi:ABC-type transport system involved in multi-copper enzyme maturation permease subunit